MIGFLSKNNLVYLLVVVNKYLNEKYDEQIDMKKHKQLVCQIMMKISERFEDNDNVDKSDANAKTLRIVKNIIDKEHEKQFFELEEEKYQQEDRFTLKLHHEPIPVIKNQVFPITKAPLTNKPNDINYNRDIVNTFEDNFNYPMKLYHDNNTNFEQRIDETVELKMEKKYEKNIQDFFKLGVSNPKPIDLERNMENYKKDMIIDPTEYMKTMQKQIIHTDLLIDSRDRNILKYPNPNSYLLDLEREIYNIISIELISAIIPNSEYIINNHNNLFHFEETNNTLITAIIPNGNYNLDTLASALQTQLNISGSSSYTVTNGGYERLNKYQNSSSTIVESDFANSYRIFDQDINTFWLASSLPSYFIYDFGENVLINRYRFICTETNGRPSDWTIEISNDKMSWITIDTKASQVTTQNVYAQYDLVSNKISGRYVRMSITDSTNSTDVHLSEFDFFTTVINKLIITSDLTGGGGLFTLKFFGGEKITGQNNTLTNIYRENSIAQIIGFDPIDYSGANNYTSNYEIILDRERNVYLSIGGIDNLRTTNEKSIEKYVSLTLTSEHGKDTYIKNTYKDWIDNIDNEFIHYTKNLTSINKMKIQFVKQNGKLYDFNGLEHCLLFRFKHYNIDGSIRIPKFSKKQMNTILLTK